MSGNFLPRLLSKNRLWFKLYKAVETEPAIVEAQRMFLVYRDMAAVSFLLLVVVPGGVYLDGAASFAAWAVAGILALQYLIAAVAARHSGIRFVTNVLAVHSTIRASPSSKSASSRKSKSSPVKRQ
jgi:hypothetical protein